MKYLTIHHRSTKLQSTTGAQRETSTVERVTTTLTCTRVQRDFPDHDCAHRRGQHLELRSQESERGLGEIADRLAWTSRYKKTATGET